MKTTLKRLTLLLLVLISMCFIGCKEEKEKYGLPEDASTYSTIEVYKVGEHSIKLDEIMWYVYMMETDMKEDAIEYEKNNNKSYYDVVVDTQNNTTVGQKVITEIEQMVTYYEIMNDLAIESEKYDMDEVYEVIKPQVEEYYKKVDKAIIDKMGLKKEVYEQILVKWSLADMYYDEVSKLYKVDPVELVKKDYSEEELKQFTDDEYEKMLDMYEESYRKQQFDNDFASIEQGYDIEKNYEMIDDIEIKLGTFTK